MSRNLRRAIAVCAALTVYAVAAQPADAASSENPSYCDSSYPDASAIMDTGMDAAVAGSYGAAIAFRDPGTDTTCFSGADRRFKTASIVKVMIAVALELQAQLANRALTLEENDRLTAMITRSDNGAASALWAQVRAVYLEPVIEQIGMTSTSLGPGGSFGDSLTTARDQLALLDFLTSPEPRFLDKERRERILILMAQTEPTQRYGVPVGAPDGTTVSVKIGYGRLGDSYFDYRTHSIGAVRTPGRYYLMAVLSDHNLPLIGIMRVSDVAENVNKAAAKLWALPNW